MMRKKVFYGVIFLSLLLILLFLGWKQFTKSPGYFPNPLYRLMPFLKTTTTINDVEFEFTSKIPGYSIDPKSVDSTLLKTALTKLELNPLKDKPFIGSNGIGVENARAISITPKYIKVILYPINLASQKDFNTTARVFYTVNLGDQPIFVYPTALLSRNNEAIEIPVYVDYELPVHDTRYNLEQLLTQAALSAIFYNFQSPPIQKLGNPSGVFYQKAGNLTQPLFQVKKNQTLMWNRFFSDFSLVPAAFAQTCWPTSGSVTCGTWQTSGTCSGGSNPGISCINDAVCGGGTCSNITSRCVASGSGTCFNTGGPGGLCLYTCTGCNVTTCSSGSAPPPSPPPGPPPPGPQPSPPPPPPPGWGACGSCDCASIGIGTNPQCQTSPGGCVWNPSTCGGGSGGPPPPPPSQLSCGSPCTSNAQCRNPSPTGATVQCIGGFCVNTNCPTLSGPSYTVPGANCDCGGNPQQCGQQCGGAFGLCAPGQGDCTFVVSQPICFQSGWQNNTYCANTYNGYTRPWCSDGIGTASYLLGPGGQTSGFTTAQIAASCTHCGDGYIQPSEQCDDGGFNGTSSSNCSATCTINSAPAPGTSAICGQFCNSTLDCASPVPLGATVICRNNTCQNLNCPAGQTQPGTACTCNSSGPRCGQPCAGPCGDGLSDCTFVGGSSCSGATYCIGDLTYSPWVQTNNADYTRQVCGGANYLRRESTLQVSGFTQAQISGTCPICGDGVVQSIGFGPPGTPGEQCDHGLNNGAPLDTCDTNCRTRVVGPSPTPTPSPGTIQARAVGVSGIVNTCPLDAAASPIPNANFGFTVPNSIPRQTQGAGNPGYVTFNGLAPTNYTLDPSPPAGGYALTRMCWSNTSGTTGSGATASLANGQTLTWNVGLSNATSWMQVIGGNLKVATRGGVGGSINLQVPSGQYLVRKDPTVTNQNNPIVSYENQLTLGSGGVANGTAYTVRDSIQNIPASFSYYNYYFNRFGTKTNVPAGIIGAAPAAGTIAAPTIYVVNPQSPGNLTTTAGVNWNIAAGQSLVIFVPGTLTINNRINIAEGGFLSFIVGGDIIVADTVGTAPIANPDKFTGASLAGICIADGFFVTLHNSAGVDVQFVGAGTFVADSFGLTRNLGGNNATFPGELFMFRPDLWANAPQELREVDVTWTEVTP